MHRRLVAAAPASAARIGASIERVTAAAASNRIRVEDAEAAAHQAIFIVDLSATNILCAHLVHVELDAMHVDGEIVVGGLVFESHAIGHARTATGVDEDAQAQIGAGGLLLADKLAKLCE